MHQLFGEFLVESGLMDAARLLEALVLQLRTTPSTAELVYDHQLLPLAEQTKILTRQQRADLDYRASASSLGLWSPSLAAKVNELVRVKRKPIGELLVQLGYLTSESLSQALAAYVSASGPQSQPLAPAKATPVDSLLAAAFIDHFYSSVGPLLVKLAQSFEAGLVNKDQRSDMLGRALTEFSGLRAAAHFMGAAAVEKLAARLVRFNQAVLSGGFLHQDQAIENQALADLLKDVHASFAHICKHLKEGLGDPETDAATQSLLAKLDEIEGRLRAAA